MTKEKQEYDYEGDMAMSQLKSIIANAKRIHDMLSADTNLPEWVQSKITLAEDYISTASNYLHSEMSEETLDELSKNTLKSYMNKADARTMDRTIEDPKAHKKAQNRTFGIEKAAKKANEEVAVNSAGAGNVAGIGVGPQGEPGVKKKKKLVMSFNRFMKK